MWACLTAHPRLRPAVHDYSQSRQRQNQILRRCLPNIDKAGVAFGFGQWLTQRTQSFAERWLQDNFLHFVLVLVVGYRYTFSYFDNIGDRRLKEILNKTPSSPVLSQNDYTYDQSLTKAYAYRNDLAGNRTGDLQVLSRRGCKLIRVTGTHDDQELSLDVFNWLRQKPA
jgi:hypothetical protein